MKKPCPYCFNFISKKDEVCPYCHKELKRDVSRGRNLNKHNDSLYSEKDGQYLKTGVSPNLEKLYKEAEEKENLEKELDLKNNKNNCESQTKKEDIYHQKNGRIKWVSKQIREGHSKKEKITNPRLTGVHIDVSDVSYFERQRNKYTKNSDRFVVEKDGKYCVQKLEWWEIYKWADRQIAKNKINKEVKKQSLNKPESVTYWILLLLSIFTGYIGLHNFYAGNYKRGCVSIISFAMTIGFVIFLDGIAFFEMFQGLLCAVPGLISIYIWLIDTIKILFKKFRYRSSKLNYIKTLDIETRARLGKKYIYIV